MFCVFVGRCGFHRSFFMPKTKQQKAETLSALESYLKNQTSVAFVDFKGLKVKDMLALRKQLKQSGAKFIVAKKTLLQKAFKNANIEVDFKGMEGEIAAVFAAEDAIAPVKNISDFAKTNEHVKLRGGYMEGSVLDIATITALANLPPLQVLRGQFVGTVAAPLSGFMNVLQGNIKGLMTVLTRR